MTKTNQSVRPWRVMAAHAVGSSHAKLSEPSQDACAAKVLSNGGFIAAVADGAGSARLAEQGAALVIDSAMDSLESLARNLPDGDEALHRSMRTVFRLAYFVLVAHADDERVPIKDLHATLSCVLVTDDFVLLGQIGDGAIALAHTDGLLELGTYPQRGEYANSTYFVTQFPLLQEIYATRIVREPVIGLMLTTDGLLDLAFEDPYGACSPFAGFMAPLFANLHANAANRNLDAKLRAFLDRPLIRNKTSDDMSLIFALREGVDLPTLRSPIQAPRQPVASDHDEVDHAPRSPLDQGTNLVPDVETLGSDHEPRDDVPGASIGEAIKPDGPSDAADGLPASATLDPQSRIAMPVADLPVDEAADARADAVPPMPASGEQESAPDLPQDVTTRSSDVPDIEADDNAATNGHEIREVSSDQPQESRWRRLRRGDRR